MQQTKKPLQQHCNKCTNKCNNSKEQTPYVWQSVPTSLNVHVIQVPRDICRLECRFRRYSGSVGTVWCLSATRKWSGFWNIWCHSSTFVISKCIFWWQSWVLNYCNWSRGKVKAVNYLCQLHLIFVPSAFYICANLNPSFLHFFKPQSVPTFQKCHNIADTCGEGNFQLLEPCYRFTRSSSWAISELFPELLWSY